MPLYMDRHDLPGATAEQVAEAHALDLVPAAKHGVQLLAYWFDLDRGEVFCFARAPAQGDLEALHREAHGLVPNEIIGVSEDNVLRFLGKINDPSEATDGTSPFRTVLFTDLEGSTSLLQDVGEAAFMVLLTEHDLIIRRALVASRGREVKHTGDGIMASFDDVSHALECSVAIQEAFDARTADGAAQELRVRIGMAGGQPVHHNDDIFGSTVNLASRICDAADAGHILASDVIHELGAKEGFTFDMADEQVLKGFEGSTTVFELLRPN
ncbi:MAG: DUF4242 domain-containing protein [Chloroflexi bacterium]|nr:DUF4242 domain-containing protein [Chloroflexota bacterium]